MSKFGDFKGKFVPGTMQFGVSSNGNEQMALNLALADGRTLTTTLSFTEAARPYSVERLVALGWKEGTPLVDEALSNEVTVRVQEREYKGEKQIDVQIVTGSGGSFKFKEQMGEAQKRAFLQRLTGVAPAATPTKPEDVGF